MEYDMMTCPFEYDSFKNLRKKEAEKYFNWYVNQIEYRITALKEAVLQDRRKIALNYSLESLIPLWDWYETKIRLVNKSEDELKKEFAKYPKWLHSEILRTKISPETLSYGMDIAVYFAEVVIRESCGRIRWGYFTTPRNRMSVNEPVLLGFKGNMDMNPRLVIVNCTRRSSREANRDRLIDLYHTWMAYVE